MPCVGDSEAPAGATLTTPLRVLLVNSALDGGTYEHDSAIGAVNHWNVRPPESLNDSSKNDPQ